MEPCFLASKSFTVTAETVPSVKPRTRASMKTSFVHFCRSKPRIPSSVTCCHGNDEKQEHPDWRSFRARLVAGETASRPAEPDTVAHSPKHITIGDKWAHKIHKPEKGCILVATEKLDGVHIFERTVVLLLSVGPPGPIGIILNRPSLMSIKEMRSAELGGPESTFSDRPLFFGGPLEDGLFLVGPKLGPDSGALEKVMEGLYYGTKESVGYAAEMVKRNVAEVGEFRFFDGYCLWSEEQLEDEVRAGYWALAACSPSVVGLGCDRSIGIWEEVIGLLGPRKVWASDD